MEEDQNGAKMVLIQCGTTTHAGRQAAGALANLAAGALFFGQFLADRTFSLTLAFAGLGTWVALMAWAIVLASEEPPS